MKPGALSTKKLNPTQVTSVMTLQSAVAHDDAHVMNIVAAMIALGARAATITRLTGLAAAVVRRLCGRERPEGPGMGRTPNSINRILLSRELHSEASLFVRFFAALHAYTGTLDAAVLVEAMRLYRDAVPTNPCIRFELALLLAESHLRRAIRLSLCSTCETRYIVSTQPVQGRAGMWHGVCPVCRKGTR